MHILKRLLSIRGGVVLLVSIAVTAILTVSPLWVESSWAQGTYTQPTGADGKDGGAANNTTANTVTNGSSTVDNITGPLPGPTYNNLTVHGGLGGIGGRGPTPSENAYPASAGGDGANFIYDATGLIISVQNRVTLTGGDGGRGGDSGTLTTTKSNGGDGGAGGSLVFNAAQLLVGSNLVLKSGENGLPGTLEKGSANSPGAGGSASGSLVTLNIVGVGANTNNIDGAGKISVGGIFTIDAKNAEVKVNVEGGNGFSTANGLGGAADVKAKGIYISVGVEGAVEVVAKA
jgi:hypothetical protein